MYKISNLELNNDIITRISTVSNEAINLNRLDSQLLNTSPAEDKWSVNQCIEHLILTLIHYLSAIEKGIDQANSKGIGPSLQYKPGIIGNWFYHKMMPITSASKSSKFKTFRKLQPKQIEEPIHKFLEKHYKFEQLVNEIHKQNLEKIRVVSLAGPLIKFKLGDAYRIVTAHNERHLLQSQNVIRDIQ